MLELHAFMTTPSIIKTFLVIVYHSYFFVLRLTLTFIYCISYLIFGKYYLMLEVSIFCVYEYIHCNLNKFQQVDLCEFKASLVYLLSFRTDKGA